MHPPLISTGVSLRSVLTEGVRPTGASDLRATSCTSDWRKVRRGDVFIALTEADQDGHDHSTEAVKRGAAAVICERHLPIFNVPQFVVADSRTAYGRLCQALLGNPSQQMKVIGIAGTHGKSTVARLMTSIFREAGNVAGTLDSFGYWDGLEDNPRSGALLTPPSLARSLAQMYAAGVWHAMLELSSRELSQAVAAGVALDAVCLTNLSRDHQNWHGSPENYRRAIGRVFEHLSSDGIAILNADDPDCVRMLDDLNHPALTIGLKQPAEITAELVEQHANEQVFMLTAGDETVGVRTAMIGDHHLYNCLSATAMALAYGVELITIARGLEAVDRLPGRMERVICGQEFAVFVDAANSANPLRACLRAARGVTSGRLICVFGSDCDSEESDRPLIGRVSGAMADFSIATSGGANLEHLNELCAQFAGGAVDPAKVRFIGDRQQAIAAALKEARAGDTVVIAGMGDRPYGRLDEDHLPLDDCEIVRQVLRGQESTVTYPRLAA